MHKLLGAALALVFVSAILSRSDAGSNDAARAIVDQAIQAHGGVEPLARTRFMVQTFTGEISSFGTAVPATRELSMHLPDQCRWSFVLEVGKDAKEKVAVQLAINGAKGWRSGTGAVKELSRPELDEQRDRAYADWLMTLLPLKDAATELTVLPEIKIGTAAAVGVKAARKGRPAVSLYFDKTSHLLVKLERKTADAGQEVAFECLLSEPKDFDGVKLATKTVEMSGGKKVAEWTLTGCKFPGQFDEGVFAKP